MSTEYILIRYDPTAGRRSMSTPKGAQTIASAQDLESLTETVAEIVGRDPEQLLADGGDRRAEHGRR